MNRAVDLAVNPNWAKLPLFDRSQWKRVRLGDVAENVNETCNPAEDDIERFIGLEHLEPGSLHIRDWGNVADGTTFTRRCRSGHVLFGKRRAYQRKVAVAEFEAVVSGDIYVMAAKGERLLPELLPFLCMSERFFKFAVETSAGSLSPRTNWSHLAQFEFDLPPLAQQRRIAEILWAADVLLEQYRTVRREIEIARQVTLAHQIRIAGDGANQFHIGQLAPEGEDGLRTGPFGSKLNAECFASEGIPIINIAAIGDGVVKEEGLMFLKPSLAHEFRAYFVRRGDLVFSRVAEIGRCMLIDEQQVGSMISSNLIRIRVNPDIVVPSYMLLLLRYCTETQNQIRQLTSTGGRMLVNTKTLSELVFAIPSRVRQNEVVEESRHFALRLHLCDETDSTTGLLAKQLRETLI
jgi:type I restriction enzyme S subunit